MTQVSVRQGRPRAHTGGHMASANRSVAMGTDLEEGHVLVLLAELVEFGCNDLARAAPRRGVVNNNESIPSFGELIVEFLSRGNIDDNGDRLGGARRSRLQAPSHGRGHRREGKPRRH
jgi:hypothetical protein